MTEIKKQSIKKRFYKSLIKWIERHCLNIIIVILHIGIKLLFYTIQVRWYELERLAGLHRQGIPVLYAFWHQRMLIFVLSHRGQNAHILVSSHRDGEIITRVLHHYGLRTVRGSSTREGAIGFYKLLSLSEQGYDLVITPDGPKGPIHEVKPGVIALAKKSGYPIIPGAYATDRCWRLKTWDQFIIPKPFSQAAVYVGEPFWIPADSTKSFDEYQKELEERINYVTAKAEELCRNPAPGGRRGLRYWKPVV